MCTTGDDTSKLQCAVPAANHVVDSARFACTSQGAVVCAQDAAMCTIGGDTTKVKCEVAADGHYVDSKGLANPLPPGMNTVNVVILSEVNIQGPTAAEFDTEENKDAFAAAMEVWGKYRRISCVKKESVSKFRRTGSCR